MTIAVGDATIHGMKAGIMVSIIKSMFIADAPQTDLPLFFRKCSQTIKKMQLGNLFMALTVIKIKDHRMAIASAGMPPIYIYRVKTKKVEEILIKGMPLGGPGSFPYRALDTALKPGDTILLSSDGYPELFNKEGEMPDYPRIRDTFAESAMKTPDEMVAHLNTIGNEWRNGRPQIFVPGVLSVPATATLRQKTIE